MADQTTVKKRLSPTVTYFLAALCALFISLFLSVFTLHVWQNGITLTPVSLACIHLTVLGFMLTVAFGVIYQIIPIAFQAPPLPRHVFTWHLPLHLMAVTGMIYGFLAGKYTFVGVFGSLLITAAGAYFVFVLSSYRKARNKTYVHRQLAWPILSLLGVTTVGLYQAFAPGQVTQHVLLTHVLLGGFGLWGGLVLVISYKLIPMFALSHGYKARLPVVSGFYFAGIGVDLVAQITSLQLLTVLGLLAASVALIGFITDMVRILKARKRKRIVRPLKESLLALLIAIVSLYLLLLSWALTNTHLALIAAYLFVFASLIPMMLGYMQKIVPFLWFEYRFSKSQDRKSAPLIDDMVPKTVAMSAYISYYIGVLFGFIYLLSAGIPVLNAPVFPILFGIFSLLGCAGMLAALAKVVTIGGKRPDQA